MRTPRIYLGIFALALLLPLLLLACGGSDEPTDEPSSERATAEPTDMPDSERATGGPETPASPARTPTTHRVRGRAHRHRCACSGLRQCRPRPTGSDETDREALVALYNATDGENWNRNANWLSDAPLWEWDGVTISDYGRVSRCTNPET